MRLVLLPFLLAGAAMAPITSMAATLPAAPPAAIDTDPPRDSRHPASMSAFVIPVPEGALNAVMYVAAGTGPHPTLLLFHGFPGNEQNLDLAQAARRAGWNVLTLHYRGSWGSPGSFSFAHCQEDGAHALAFVRQRDTLIKFRIDPSRIAVAGHSMGGIVAARVAADDPQVLGAFLIDPADFAAIGRGFSKPSAREDFLDDEVRGDMPPLSGTSEQAIMDEVEHAGPNLDLVATVPALAGRPLALIGAQRGIGTMAAAAAQAARKAGAKQLDAETMPTDHSFSDMRIALATRLVTWLARFQR